jgi:DHA2 family multidrug resistance protein-like MFS transporter
LRIEKSVRTVGAVDRETIQARRWWILGVLVISLLVVILDNTILNVALNTIQEDLHASQADVEWAVNSYVLVFAGLLFTWGILGDRHGRKKALLLGLGIFGLMSVLAAFSQNTGQLIAFRALMGIGGAAVLPQTLSIITNVFEPQERGRAIGIWAGFSGVAVAVGPITGGFLLEHFWWGSIFLINVPVVIVGIVLVAFIVPDSKDPHPSRLDPPGVLLSIAGLVSLVYGIIKGGQDNQWTSPLVLGTVGGGVALLALFVLIERRSSHPSLDISLFRNPQLSAATAAIGLAFFALMGVTFYFSFYLQAVRGYSPFRAGLCLVAVAAAIMITAPQSAKLARRFGTRVLVGTALIVVAIGFALQSRLTAETPLWIVEALLVIQGLGMGNVMAPATNAVMGAIPRAKSGAGSAVNNTIRQVGGALGVAILGSVLSTVYRSQLGSAVDVLPAAARHDAAESIGGTYAALGAAGPAAGRLQQAASDAFVHAMHVTALCAVVVVLMGSAVVWLYLPGRRAGGGSVETGQHEAPVVPAEPVEVVGAR